MSQAHDCTLPPPKCKHGFYDRRYGCGRCGEERTLLEGAAQDDPREVQSFGHIAEAVVLNIHDLDLTAYTVMDISNLIDALKAIRKARLQKGMGFAKSAEAPSAGKLFDHLAKNVANRPKY